MATDDHSETIQTEFTGTASYTIPLTAACPFDDRMDHYTVTITVDTDGEVPELRSLAATVADYQGMELSQEDLTEQIAGEFLEYDIAASVTVELEGEHYGVEAVTKVDR